MKKQKHAVAFNKNRRGLSLIEVLIFVLLLSLILITMTYSTLVSVRNSKIAQDRIRATRLGQELQEWLRGQKEYDFDFFQNNIDTGQTYCVNSIPGDITELSVLVPCPYSLQNTFKRELTINGKTSSRITYTVYVEWQDATNIHHVTLSSTLSVWE